VSNQGGTQPEWRRDGAELFYLAANSTLMSVGFKQSNKLTMSVPKELFRLSLLMEGCGGTITPRPRRATVLSSKAPVIRRNQSP